MSRDYGLAKIESAILFLRGQKVMLDRDLAALYRVETRVLNQAVRRNIRRFPPDFVFELTRQEVMRISQIVTSSPGIKFSKRVHAFTEQDVMGDVVAYVNLLPHLQSTQPTNCGRPRLASPAGLPGPPVPSR